MSEALGTCGPYTLLKRIGAGGMGEIFLAQKPGEGPVAIKRLLAECASDPIFIGMFLDEARLVTRLQHPNICAVYEHGQDARSHYYLVMEHVDGVSLRELLEARAFRGLDFALACRVIAEVASALDYAHRQEGDDGIPLGIVHRDVSPANIMIRKDGVVKLVDFGLAKARTQLFKTQPGMVKGKFGYLAPEQLRGTIDWKTDVFALGLCFYESLTGHPIFDQRTAAETVQAIQAFHGPAPIAAQISGAPASLDVVLQKVTHPDPEQRYESAAAFRSALGEVVVESGRTSVHAADLAAIVPGYQPPAPAGSQRSKPTKSTSPLPWLLFAGLGVGAVLLCLIGAVLASC